MALPDTSKPSMKKQRPPPKPVTVQSIERVTPGVLRIAFTGPDLDNYAQAKPGAHIKLFFAPGAWPPPAGAGTATRPPSRTYTPRRYDAATSRLEVEFVMHGAGLASDWATQAKVGDAMLVAAGPGGGYVAPEGIANIVIVADDTAMPAAGMVVESLPASCRILALCEIEDAAEERPLSPDVACKPAWLHRKPSSASPSSARPSSARPSSARPSSARPGSLLEAAVAALPSQPADTQFWIACEAGAMRRIRDFLTKERGVERARLHTRGYWKYGDLNYPDHDYGDD